MADSELPPPANLEYKSTKDTLIGHTPAAVPHVNLTGTALSAEQRAAADQVTGSPAQGNAVVNPEVNPSGGVTTASGGTQTSPAVGKTKTES